MWIENIYPFPIFNGAAVKVCKWISNFIPHFIIYEMIYPCWCLIQSVFVKWYVMSHSAQNMIYVLLAKGKWFQQPRLTTSPPGQMATIVADDNLKCILLNENKKIPNRISLKFVPGSPIDNKPTLLQVMAWRRTGAKPIPEPILT